MDRLSEKNLLSYCATLWLLWRIILLFVFSIVHLKEQIHPHKIPFRSLKLLSFSILVLYLIITCGIMLAWASWNSFHRKFFFTKLEKKKTCREIIATSYTISLMNIHSVWKPPFLKDIIYSSLAIAVCVRFVCVIFNN